MARSRTVPPGHQLLLATLVGLVLLGILAVIQAMVSPPIHGLTGYPWRTTTGLVESSRVVERAGPGSAADHWIPEVVYRYSIAGKEYTSRRITRGPLVPATRQRAERLAARYPVGAPVTVHYRDTFETMAMLDREFLPTLLLLGAGAAVVFLAGIGLRVQLSRQAYRHRAQPSPENGGA